MKKITIASILSIIYPGIGLVHADPVDLEMCAPPCGTYGAITSGCNVACLECMDTNETQVNGVITRETGVLDWICPGWEGDRTDCSCRFNETYLCAAGYFGTPTDYDTGCISCELATGRAGVTSNQGARSITECYLPAGTTFNNAFGSAEFETKCNYSL